MGTNLVGKRVLVLSDNNGLSRVIEFNLKHKDLEVIKAAPSLLEQQGEQSEIRDVDLIVVAMISPHKGLVMSLAQAALGEGVEQVPLLIISERPFSDLDGRAAHLDFPFDLDRLYDKVQEILQKEP